MKGAGPRVGLKQPEASGPTEGSAYHVFCPNCGSKNEDSAPRCAQCGFEIQSAKPAPRFKGTMVMQSPVAAGASPHQAPPNASPARAPAALKGTMVGVAPPGMDDLRKQIAEARQGPDRSAVASKLKGTMIGLAPPDGSGVGDIQPTLLGVAPPSASEPPPAAGPATQATPPSRLKGTMVGVAPPDLGQNVQSPDAFGGTMMAGATAPMAAVTSPITSPIATAVTEPSPPPSGEPDPIPPVALPRPSGARATPDALAGGPRYPTSDPAPGRASTPSTSNSSQLPIVLLIGLVVVVALALVAFGLVMRGGSSAEPESAVPTTPASATP